MSAEIGGDGVRAIGGDHDTFTGGQTVGLQDEWKPERTGPHNRQRVVR